MPLLLIKNSNWDISILIDNKRVTNESEDLFRQDLYDIEINYHAAELMRYQKNRNIIIGRASVNLTH